MGCCHSLPNRIQVQHSFNSDDILYLTQSWNILKAHDITKFADEVLIKAINQNSTLRQFWTSKLIIDGNNFDFSQGESCLRTDLSWRIGLRDHSIHFILTLDKLISSIKDEHLLLTQIHSLYHLRNLSITEYDSLMTIKQSIIETIRQRFQLFKYDFTINYEKSWDKFLLFIIKNLSEKDNRKREPAKIIISPATMIDQQSSNILNT